MRLDQEMDVTTEGMQGAEDPTSAVTTTWFVLQRFVVQQADTSGTDVLQVTDSVATATEGGPNAAPVRPHPRVAGTEVHLHFAPDGAVRLLDSPDHVSSALREVLADLPVTFPHDPVKVGHTWVRTMKLPAGSGYTGDSDIKLEFKLDSVSSHEDTAYVSVHGPLGKPRVDAVVGGATLTTRGTLIGSMVIDRRRGWLTDWHAVIDVRYTVRPPRGSDAAPEIMRMMATQWLRAVDRP